MKKALAETLARWIESTLAPDTPAGDRHCFEIRRRFRIPGAGEVDLLTVRHLLPSPSGPDHFAVDLWSIDPATIGDGTVDAMTRRLHAFRAWYADLLETAETQGFSPAHRVSVCGNLVGAAIRRSPLIDLLSTSGSSLSFWTWRSKGSALEVSPYYGRTPSLASARTQLKGLLHHLPWEDTSDRPAAEKHPSRS